MAAVQSWPVLISDAGDRPVDRGLEVGVVEHHERGLAAQFQVQALAGRARRRCCCPTGVDPVNDTMLTSRWVTRRRRRLVPRPVTTLITPSGIPAAVAASANISEVSGVISAGLSTMVLPAATAGRIFHAAICSG